MVSKVLEFSPLFPGIRILENEAVDRCFSVRFSFSVKTEAFELRLEERRRGFCGFISLGLQCSMWLMATVEEALKAPVIEDFVKYFREDVKALIVQGGGNKAGHYLEVVAYDEGGRKGAMWLPEGCEDWGWSRVVDELRQMLAFLESKERPPVSEELISEGKQKGGYFAWSLLRGSAMLGGQR